MTLLKFRLSTLLLLVVIAAMALGWYVDHHDRSRRELLGTWHFPTPDQPTADYNSTLVIRADGSFVKSEENEFTSTIFSGKYIFDGEGRVIFHVQSKREESGFLQAAGKPHTTSQTLNAKYYCRCAVDKDGYLIVASAAPAWTLTEFGDVGGMRWERTFVRK